MSAERWRQVIAAFANPDARQVAARVMLGASLAEATEGLSPSRSRKTQELLRHTGLVDAQGRFNEAVFRELLAAEPTPRKTGIERFVDGRRIHQFPANLDERGELLRWVVEQVLQPGEVLDERTLNERLEPFHPDVAMLRRYLVDFELLERTRDGREYARA